MADTPKKTTKRLVKNPETFRERAIKAADETDKPTRSSRLRSAGAAIGKPVARPIGKASAKVAGFKPFRILRKPLRLIGRILVPNYIRNSWRELRQVQWPNRRESLRLTRAVLIFAIIFGAVIAGVDYVLDKIFKELILK